MAVYSITHHQRLDDYAVVQLLTNADITPGDTITIAGLGHGLNGTYTVYACPLFLYTGVDDQGDLLLDPQFPIENQVLFLRRRRRVRTVRSDTKRNANHYARLYLDHRNKYRGLARHWNRYGFRSCLPNPMRGRGKCFWISPAS